MLLKRRPAIVAAILCCTLLSAAAWWSGRESTAEPPRVSAPDATTEAVESRSIEVDDLTGVAPWSPIPLPATRTTPAESLPLPPLGTPVADVFAELERRGRQGDPAAACRLATELLRCTQADFFARAAEDAERDVARAGSTPQQAIDYIAQAQSRSEANRAGCDGLSAEQLASTFDWQRHAAMLDPSLRRDFAIRPALNPRDFLTDLDRWAEYRRLAVPWLEAAARDGDVPAIIALARIYGDRRAHTMPWPPFRIHDDERFVVYAELMDRYGAGVDIVRRIAGQTRAQLEPAQLARVEQRITDLFDPSITPLDAVAASRAIGSSLRSDFSPEHCGPADTASPNGR